MPFKPFLMLLMVVTALHMPRMARAQEPLCDFQPEIVALTDYVLDNRKGLARFKGLRFGAVSAYLKIRYGKLDEKQAEALLMPLFAARVSRADELLFTWSIHTYGVDAAAAIVGPRTSDLLLSQAYGASVVRAAISRDGISAISDRLAGVDPERRFRAEIRIPMALLDKFDTFKNEIARQAEAKGLMQVAAGLAATQSSGDAWKEFAARVKDSQLLNRAVSFWYWTPALVGRPPLERPAADPQWEAKRAQFHRVMIAAASMPERDFLATYLNQSGRYEEAGKVAETIITIARAVREDANALSWTMDRAWITAYLELLTVTDDPTDVDRQLDAIPFGGLRHYDGSVRDVLDWMIAADVLKPYILAQTDAKDRPAVISEEFAGDWPAWVAAADAIRNGTTLNFYRATPTMQAIVSELLFATSRRKQLADFITGSRPTDASVALAEDFANRLDRTCYGYLNLPAEAVAFPDAPMFRFD